MLSTLISRRSLRLFASQPAENRRLVLEALLCLGLARLAILAVPFSWITRAMSLKTGQGVRQSAETARSREFALSVGWAVRAAASRTPWQSACLAQGLAAAAMLRRRRIPFLLSLGVAKSATGQPGFEAHAWIFCADVPVTGGDPGRYRVIAEFS